MTELLRTADAVLLTYIGSLLKEAGIEVIVADAHMSAVEGSIGAFPRRVLVFSEDAHEAASILSDAGLARYLRMPASGSESRPPA